MVGCTDIHQFVEYKTLVAKLQTLTIHTVPKDTSKVGLLLGIRFPVDAHFWSFSPGWAFP